MSIDLVSKHYVPLRASLVVCTLDGLVIVDHKKKLWRAQPLGATRHHVLVIKNQVVQKWNVRTGVLERVFVAHNERVVKAFISSDGTRAVTLGNDNRAIVWNAVTGKIQHRLAGYAKEDMVAVTDDTSMLLTVAAWSSDVRSWNLVNGERIPLAYTNDCAYVFLSPDATHILGIKWNWHDKTSNVRIMDLRTGAHTTAFNVECIQYPFAVSWRRGLVFCHCQEQRINECVIDVRQRRIVAQRHEGKIWTDVCLMRDEMSYVVKYEDNSVCTWRFMYEEWKAMLAISETRLMEWDGDHHIGTRVFRFLF